MGIALHGSLLQACSGKLHPSWTEKAQTLLQPQRRRAALPWISPLLDILSSFPQAHHMGDFLACLVFSMGSVLVDSFWPASMAKSQEIARLYASLCQLHGPGLEIISSPIVFI